MTPRPLHAIARDIEKHWPNPSHYVKPYLMAMKTLNKITDSFYADSAKSVVLYFLSNANSWKGEDARRIKAELKEMVK